MKKVQVLLSTYNGEKYLTQQIESILQQKDVKISLLIRDDGSEDNTVNILKKFKSKYDSIELYCGDNIGWKDSFMKLIYMSGDFDFFAFADQDDFWLPNKLISAINKIYQSNTKKEPKLYYSDVTLTDKNLNKIGKFIRKRPDNKISVLFNPCAQGSTIVFNKKLRNLIKRYKPKDSYAHDMWVFILCYYFGLTIYDSNSYLLYRQHDNNVSIGGKKPSILHLVKSRLIPMLKENIDANYAQDILDGYKEILTKKDAEFLYTLANYKSSFYKKLKILLDPRVKKMTLRGTLFLKLSILLSKYGK
ncbi:glycosyltransferase [Halanaerobium congolense]|uniref:glycosyltransferase n=1 Tax=Halanaerobium congolense TaxID=54121 RepID=UPI00091E7AEE|nr:glycosyltransferase [Halanaerobium congolense]SHN11306.1 Glycosyl transferase family 2 [Halanaerobium congolense]